MSEIAKPPKRLSLSQILELLLTRGGGERSAVTLARTASGETTIEVKVRTGDDSEIVTADDAEQKARDVYERLRQAYPTTSEDDSAAVTLTRNAKGHTQIELVVRAGGERLPTIDQAADKASELYRSLRARFPTPEGTVEAGAS